MKVLGKIFNPEKLVNSAISGVDKAFFTNEEKSDNFKELLKLYEPYKLAQRILAIMFTGTFLLMHLIVGITHLIYVVRELDCTKIIELYEYNNESLGTSSLVIISFYFAGGVLEGTVNKLKKPK